ncbi:MAG: hypothetical protein M3O91_09690 [Chloroflexota bacterium]|nr:hypothetical protein [Chloroflexota bacterium]
MRRAQAEDDRYLLSPEWDRRAELAAWAICIAAFLYLVAHVVAAVVR